MTKDEWILKALDYYDVARDGTIWRKNSTYPLKWQDKNGYAQVGLFIDGRAKNVSVHRVVAAKYLGPSSLSVNHKDGNKLNNHISNLEYMSLEDNYNHYLEGHGKGVRILLDAQKVKELREEYNSTKITMRQLAKKFGISHHYIVDLIDNKHWVDPDYTRTRVFRRPWAKKGYVA